MRPKPLSHTIVLALVGIALLACGGDTSKSDLFSPSSAQRAVAEILQRSGHDQPRAYMVKITPEQLTLRLENPKEPGTLQEWWYYKGKARGPEPVTLLGEGSIEPGLIALSEIDFEGIPKIVDRTRDLWKLDPVLSMELRVRKKIKFVALGENGLVDDLQFDWLVEGKKQDTTQSITVPSTGEVPMPAELQAAAYAKERRWAEVLQVCDYSSVKHNSELGAECNKHYDAALEVLATQDAASARRICRYASRVGDALTEACARRVPNL